MDFATHAALQAQVHADAPPPPLTAAYLAIGVVALACLIARAGGVAAVRRNAGNWREVAEAAVFVVVGWPVALVLITRRAP